MNVVDIFSKGEDYWKKQGVKLDPELQDYYTGTSSFLGFPTLKHPLVYQVPYLESYTSVALANQSLKWKKEKLQEYIDAEDYSGMVMVHEKAHRASAFFNYVFDEAPPLEAARLLLEIYVNTENYYQNKDMWGVMIDSLRDELREVVDEDDKTAWDEYIEKGEPITVYRGVRGERYFNGHSWTVDEEKAIWFAKRFGGSGQVCEGKVDPQDILICLVNWGESELVVNPKKVKQKKHKRYE